MAGKPLIGWGLSHMPSVAPHRMAHWPLIGWGHCPTMGGQQTTKGSIPTKQWILWQSTLAEYFACLPLSWREASSRKFTGKRGHLCHAWHIFKQYVWLKYIYLCTIHTITFWCSLKVDNFFGNTCIIKNPTYVKKSLNSKITTECELPLKVLLFDELH